MIISKISVFTPSNNPEFLPTTYQSLCAQSWRDWEWVVLLNGGARITDLMFCADDSRVRIFTSSAPCQSIGYWKAEACKAASGDILVELDHDDQLLPSALERVAQVFDKRPDVGFVYSNAAAIHPDWSPNEDFGAAYGWEYREREVYGHKVRECRSPKPWPQNLAFIYYAPDHLRAWRRTTYEGIGGHDRSLTVGDDHDLVCRTYLATEMYHLDDLLYLYTVHGENHSRVNNAAIQEAQWANYHKYVGPLALHWAKKNHLLAVDLCGGINSPEGYISVDLHDAHINADLEKRWPFDDNSVGVLRASDALEHLSNPIHSMNEAHRVLAHGGFFSITVPSTDGRGAFQDPSHRSFWNSNSLWYYCDRDFQRYISHAGATARFQRLYVDNVFPSDFNRLHNIPYLKAHLIALKDGPRFHGLVSI